jgi:ribosome maturation factor RimP
VGSYLIYIFAVKIIGKSEGGQKSPFLLEKMLKDQIIKLAEEKIAGTECFLVDVKVSPSKILVFIDKMTGIKIEDCVDLSRYIQEKLEGTDILEHHELDVSSPGMDEPLKVFQQYQKRIGKEISVVTFDGQKHTGILKSVTEQELELEMSSAKKINGKKEITSQLKHFPFSEIKETKVVFSFDKILK